MDGPKQSAVVVEMNAVPENQNHSSKEGRH
mgnify:CR=1 FL=1